MRTHRNVSWLDTPPAGKYVLVFDAQAGGMFLLELCSEELWQKVRDGRTFSRVRLETCSLRAGWRFHPIELPDPPESEWSDAPETEEP